LRAPAPHLNLLVSRLGVGRWLGWIIDSPRPFKLGLIMLVPFLVMSLLPGIIAPYDPLHTVAEPLAPPTLPHLLGTDEIGRDILSRVIWGARADMFVSVVSTALAFVVGSLFGLIFGYLGGVADTLAMRVVDVLLAFPTIVLALFLIVIFGRGRLDVEAIAIAIVMMPSMARLARGVGLILRQRAYVEASVLLHASTWHVVWRHLVPNALPTLLVAASVLGASSILIAASLSYLGLGLQYPTPSWGGLLRGAYNVVFASPIYGLAPGICVTVVALGYMQISNGLRVRYSRRQEADMRQERAPGL
jgi:peptide/nickel transport system permease protein